ncbi:radical SAM family heme chaperone HemW [Nanchangia anserum]|uniref:radical SAM family heme chaperone HemW n=1 Tax=Nanchangia anserum TaxID=2692125 RepID=UPI001D110692|nr:radical SAM family heme chaperone HemW [Nanchangia anserum]
MSTFGVYVHVPFCTVRCGYCDFNTYTVGFGEGAEPDTYAASIERELAQATASGLTRVADTVYLGGGTPSLLPADELERILDSVRRRVGVRAGAEVSMEANPDTVTPEAARRWARAGVTRVSMGMQSAVSHVLRTLERTHRPESIPAAVAAVREAGMDVSLDLIYGTPGESLADWEASLRAVIGLVPDHISAYGLVVEEGTKMGRLVRTGVLPAPDDDDEAMKYRLADGLLGEAGYRWYEISNWARPDEDEADLTDACDLRHVSRHNLAYWREGEWWGCGPGAHSFVGGRRWWNVKHPRAYAARLRAGESPRAGEETPDAEARRLEHLMLGIRLSSGLAWADAGASSGGDHLRDLVSAGYVSLRRGGVAVSMSEVCDDDRVVLTLKGRLLADEVTRRLAFG